jgi:hypothetical protein
MWWVRRCDFYSVRAEEPREGSSGCNVKMPVRSDKYGTIPNPVDRAAREEREREEGKDERQ